MTRDSEPVAAGDLQRHLVPPLVGAGLVVACGLVFAVRGMLRASPDDQVALLAAAAAAGAIVAGLFVRPPLTLAVPLVALATGATTTWMIARVTSSAVLAAPGAEGSTTPLPLVAVGLVAGVAVLAGVTAWLRLRLVPPRR